MSALGNRIKRYEKTFHHTALHRSPLMIRVDGRAFHTFTRKLKKPFDVELMSAMVSSACQIAKDMQGFKAGYVQSDEATFCLTDYDTVETQGCFDYDLSKIVSISAAMMSVAFNANYPSQRRPVFDSRAFSLPVWDVVNAFLWRAKDWERNSLQMYARSFFSHKELHRVHGGFPEPQHNRSAPLARQEPSDYAVPDPITFPLSKALQAACPMQNT